MAINGKRVYLDNAASTPLDERVIELMNFALKNVSGNPSSIHAEGRKAKTELEKSRKTIARILNISPSELIFTSGGTEADNMALRLSVSDLGVKNIITSPIEHHAVLNTAKDLESNRKVKIHYLSVDEKGIINLNELEKLLSETPDSLVSLMHGNNELGNLNDIERIGGICRNYNAIFHTDTVQTIGHYDLDFGKLNVDFATASAHKFNGPKGIGFLYVSKRNKISSLMTGGEQERSHRPGTVNVPSIMGMAKALEISLSELEKEQKRVFELKEQLKKVLVEDIEDIAFNGDLVNSMYKVLSVSFPNILPLDLFLFQLDLHGISVSAGSACASGANKGSHVLDAIKAPKDRNYIRFSFGRFNNQEDIVFLRSRLKEIFSQNH